MSFANSPSCLCCAAAPTTCAVLPAHPFADIANWSVVSGTWGVASGSLSGEDDGAIIVTNLSASRAQYLACNVKANAANQVVDIMFGCDASGTPSSYLRLTFGDSSDAKPCGSVQFFYDGVAIEDATPVLRLRDGQQFGVTTCFDAALGKWLVILTGDAGVPFGEFYSATASPSYNPSGRLGLRLQAGNGASVEFRVRNGAVDGSSANNAWYNLFLTGSQTCRACNGCGVTINAWFEANGNNCVATTSGISTGVGYASVSMNVVVSAYDRSRGYGAKSGGVLYCTTADEGRMTMQLGGYAATLHFGPVIGTHPDQSNAVYLEFEGQTTTPIIFGNPGGGPYGSPATFGTAVVEIWIWFCDGEVFATGGVVGNYSEILSVTGEPAAGGGDGASMSGAYDSTYAGVSVFGYTRCYACNQCETCEDVEVDRQWEVVIEATPNTYNGTYVMTDGGANCLASYAAGGYTVNLLVSRAFMRVSIGFAVSGQTSEPITNCEDVVGLVIPITGSVVGTATVTAL